MTRGRKLLLSVLVVGLIGGLTGAGTYASFSSTTASGGNNFSAGTVVIGDNDAGSSLISLSNAKPSDSSTGCIAITYTGSLNADVKLYGSTTGSLAAYLTLTVTRGSDPSPSFPGCGGFTADTGDYGYGSNGIVYQGNLSAYPGSYGSGIADPQNWSTNDQHVYKVSVTLQNTPSAQGLSSTAAFTWEARNT